MNFEHKPRMRWDSIGGISVMALVRCNTHATQLTQLRVSTIFFLKYDSMVCRVSITTILEPLIFATPKRKSVLFRYHCQALHSPPPAQSLATTNLLSVSTELPLLDTSHECDRITSGLL